VVSRTAPPWRLDWTRLSAIEPGALPALTKLFYDWAGKTVELRMTAADHLDQLLATGAPTGERTVAPEWWHARMALLRVMSRMDDFELAALNYCVTYEVSPPSWETPRCTCKTLNADGRTGEGPLPIVSSLDSPSAAMLDARATDFRSTTMESMLLPPVKVELSGTIIGDLSETLEKLDKQFAGADILSIACGKLVRVDFAAAGTLLNWVSMRHSEGREVQFSGVHRLIAGFFNVVGISEIAQILVRTD
jgi:ABC-type transporter Mla MlaB component